VVIITVAVGAYAVVATKTLRDRAAEWRDAGERVEALLNDVYVRHPQVGPETTFYFIDLPKKHGQASFLGTGGLRSALKDNYRDPSLHVYTGDHPDLSRTIEAATRGAPVLPGVYVYVYRDGQLVDRSSSANDPAVREMLDRYAIFP
jgi:hypothetical protein